MKSLLVLMLIASLCVPALAQQTSRLEKVTVNGVELHYQDQGEGDPVVLVHGGFLDYRAWFATVAALSKHYRVIAYSRRYNFPNENTEIAPDHSARIGAQDLKGLIDELDLGPVHLVGHSYGGFTALFLAIDHPELVRSLTVGEPALMRWLADIPDGAVLWQRFDAELRPAMAKAIRAGDEDGMLRLFFDWVMEPDGYDQLPPVAKALIKNNVREGSALMISTNPFPTLLREDVEKLEVPILMLSGANTIEALKLIDAELERLLPNVKRIILPDATHNMFMEQPAACNQAIIDFLGKR